MIAIESSPVRPRVWLRYVDDTYSILKRGMESQMLDHLNGIRPEIQFTMETEKDGKLPFLDCEVMRKKEGGLSISVYRKSTHTDRYLHFDSHHPVHVKRGVVKCLFNRAEKVTTEVENISKRYLVGMGIQNLLSPTPPTEIAHRTSQVRMR